MDPTTHGEIGSASALIMIVVASIGTDRIVHFVMALMSKVKWWARLFPNPYVMEEGPARDKAMKKLKGLYSISAGLVGGVGLAGFCDIQVLHMLGFDPEKLTGVAAGNGFWIDCVMTGLVFMVGAEKAQQFLKLSGFVPEGHKAQAVDIAGTFLLDPEAIARADQPGPAEAAPATPPPPSAAPAQGPPPSAE